MDLKTATTYWRESGGEYDQKSERAIISIPALQKFVVSVIGWTLINNQDGEALLSLKDKLRTAEQELESLRAKRKADDGSPSEIEMHRMAFKMIQDHGFSCPEELLAAYRHLEKSQVKLSKEVAEALDECERL
jgi:hypothetical protein